MMKQSEQPLYPKLSSIYNKILQLVSAILLIVILMTFWVANTEKSTQVLGQHFNNISSKFLQQTIAGISVLLTENKSSISQKIRNAQLQFYLNNLTKTDFVKQVHLYDETGLLLFKSEINGAENTSIKTLFGIDESRKTLDKSARFVPFIGEIRHDKLIGYVRLTVEKSYLTSVLDKNSEENQTLFRLLLIIAGLISFLLTRGLNRFSRQGFRAPQRSATIEN